MLSKRIHIKEEALMRKRRRDNRIKKLLNIRKSTRRKFKSSGKHNYQQDFDLTDLKFTLPSNFSLLSNPDDVIALANDVIRTVRSYNQKCNVRFNLYDVENVDDGAIGVLLSIINALAKSHVSSFGNVPNNEIANDKFLKSGFFDHVRYLNKSNPLSKTKNNWIVARGRDKTQNALIGKEIRKLIRHLTGTESSFPPLYSMIQEICANSIEHANDKLSDKNWLISFQYYADSVGICMIDIGKGILSTLRKKVAQTLRDTIFSKDAPRVLYGVFSKEYQSSTFEANRNKGLPKVKECFDLGRISDLCVITNNAYLDFNGKLTRKLNSNFRGTFFSWVITIDNINKWQNKIAS